MATSTVTPSETTARRPGRLAGVDWHRYVIYIGFVVVFVFFVQRLGTGLTSRKDRFIPSASHTEFG